MCAHMWKSVSSSIAPYFTFETEFLTETATNSARLTSWQVLGILLWPPLQFTVLYFVMLYKFWVTNSCPSSCAASAFLTEPSPDPMMHHGSL